MLFRSISGSSFPSEIIPLYVSELRGTLPAGWISLAAVFIDEGAVLILRTENDGEDRSSLFLRYLEKKSASMKRQTGYTPLTVLSPPVFSPDRLSETFLLCRGQMAETEFFRQEHTVIAEEVNPGDFRYLRQGDQKVLADAVREGNLRRAVDRIDRILEEVTSSGISGADAARCILFSTLTAVIQTVSTTPAGTSEFMCGYNEFLAAFFRAEDITSMRDSLDRIVRISCEEIARRRSGRRERLFRDIERYVNANLTDREMYLPSVAEHFNLNPKYLTGFFKENSGIPLAEYIRRARVERACELILKGSPVYQAAEKSGFSNIISFNRVFKQLKKMTPTEFRREHRTGRTDG